VDLFASSPALASCALDLAEGLGSHASELGLEQTAALVAASAAAVQSRLPSDALEQHVRGSQAEAAAAGRAGATAEGGETVSSEAAPLPGSVLQGALSTRSSEAASCNRCASVLCALLCTLVSTRDNNCMCAIRLLLYI
jgi:hypothetical protein